jgi:hypothetical protein
VTGQNVVFVGNLATNVATAVFFTDAYLNSGNVIFTVPMNSSAGGVNVNVQPGTTFAFAVGAFDNYFTGTLTDAVENMRFTPGNARFGVAGDPFGTVPPRSVATVPVTKATVPDSASTESGLLLLYRRNALIESEVVKVK